jgi:hypothetical protein
MTRLRGLALLVAAVLAGMLALSAPAYADNPVGTPKGLPTASVKYPGMWWQLCEDGPHHQEIIFFEKDWSTCGTGFSDGLVWGFASVTYYGLYTYKIEPCQYHSNIMYEHVDMKDAMDSFDGVRTYSAASGTCDQEYPPLTQIRKFQAEWGGEKSPWELPWG